ncbi:MAG: MarR family transcriptional regulator [Candidatus Cloacimonetes bacterium]|nr:MarR family transcriptional regulator [Candidatus Cloacimonadota bacterium]
MMKNKNDYGTENNLNLKLVIALTRTNSEEYKRTRELVSGYGLTIAQFGVLETLYHLGDMCINELISKTLSTSGNMTVVIKNLERDGYVIRISSPEDKRSFNIRLTLKGREMIERIFPRHLEDLKNGFSNLCREEKEQLITLLKKLNGYESEQKDTTNDKNI